MEVKLIPLDGEWENRLIAVDKSEFIIGRSADCDLPFDHSLVSLRHCRIRHEGDRLTVEDLGSVFGTSVNGRKVRATELHDGDRLKVGPTTFMVALTAARAETVSAQGAYLEDDDEDSSRTRRGRDPNADTAAVEKAREIFERLTTIRAKQDPARPVVHAADRGKSKVEVEEADGITVVNILERSIVQENEIEQIGEELERLIDKGRRNILLDFGHVKHMSSQAVGLLLQAQRRCKAGGGVLKVCSPNPEVAEIFKITNLPRVIEIHPDEDQALQGPWPELPPPNDAASPEPAAERPAKPSLSMKEIAARFAGPATPTLRGEPQVRLVIEVGKSKGKALKVAGPSFSIGRDASCQLRPASEAVSRLHARIDQRDGRVFVRDMGGTNGTVLGNRVLKNEEVEAHDGDRLQIGPLAFRFSITPGAEPTPADNPEDAAASWLMQGPIASGDTAHFPVAPVPPESKSGLIFQRLRHQVVGDALLVTILAPELLDEEQLGPIRHELLSLLDQPVPKRLVVKLDKVRLMSSSAIAMFMAHFQRLDRLGGGMRFAQVGPEVLPALEHQRFGMLIEIFPSVEAALREPWPMT
jgi:anti-anti-sigma factor